MKIVKDYVNGLTSTMRTVSISLPTLFYRLAFFTVEPNKRVDHKGNHTFGSE